MNWPALFFYLRFHTINEAFGDELRPGDSTADNNRMGAYLKTFSGHFRCQDIPLCDDRNANGGYKLSQYLIILMVYVLA